MMGKSKIYASSYFKALNHFSAFNNIFLDLDLYMDLSECFLDLTPNRLDQPICVCWELGLVSCYVAITAFKIYTMTTTFFGLHERRELLELPSSIFEKVSTSWIGKLYTARTRTGFEYSKFGCRVQSALRTDHRIV